MTSLRAGDKPKLSPVLSKTWDLTPTMQGDQESILE